jgi:hypothetical protein
MKDWRLGKKNWTLETLFCGSTEGLLTKPRYWKYMVCRLYPLIRDIVLNIISIICKIKSQCLEIRRNRLASGSTWKIAVKRVTTVSTFLHPRNPYTKRKGAAPDLALQLSYPI